MSRHYLLLLLIPMFLYSCKNTETVVEAPRVYNLDTIRITPPKFVGYQETATKAFDLIHTRLDVRFDWEKQYLYGKANLTLSPWFYATDSLTLDAKGFDLHQVGLINNAEGFQELKYTYDGAKLKIQLDKTYKKGDTLMIFVDYTAKPNELEAGGSAAITSDKGLYFINPLGKEPGKPRQIWTQGETEASSCWFPTIDKPNQNTTQEILMTVDSQFVTLSNGLLVESTRNMDGTRTDHWQQTLPHAPYLFMMTVGDFAQVDTNWQGMPMAYYLEHAYKKDAQAIFGNTPEMLSFFSARLGYKYPWEKYSQIIVRDYVSGAMENTTANLYFSMLQRTTKELEDYGYESIIAHELIHQWFGDLLTCESWSNLPLNESFANYGEYLWEEHKYGNYSAEQHRLGEWAGYLAESKGKKEKLIRFYYEDKEDMFDAHSYNKGGLILNHFRNLLGDEAFFAAVQLYLEQNEFQPVEYNNLRLAFEEVTGEDLNWFFEQWFLSAGHPVLEISYEYNEPRKSVKVNIKQLQRNEEKDIPVFRLPMYVDIYEGGEVRREKIVLEGEEESFTFYYKTKPDLVNVDATKTIPAEKDDQHTMQEWIFMYNNAPQYFDKIEALNALLLYVDSSAAVKTLLKALEHEYPGIREHVVNRIPLEKRMDSYETIKGRLIKIAKDDSNNEVATAAMYRLANIADESLMPVFTDVLEENRSYILTAATLEAIMEVDIKLAYGFAQKFDKETNAEVLSTVSAIYTEIANKADQDFYETMTPKTIGYEKYALLSDYGDFLAPQDPVVIRKGIPMLETFARHAGTWWDKYAAASSIHTIIMELRSQVRSIEGEVNSGDTPNALAQGDIKPLQDLLDELEAMLNDIKSKETNKTLISRYKNLY